MDFTRILTINDACTLATIVRWSYQNARITWLDDRGDVALGTARSIGDQNGNFASGNDDVRDCFLRITTDGGFEWFVPMTDVMARHEAGTMVSA